MRIIPDQLRSKNLVPFKKRRGRYKIPGLTAEHEVVMDRVDPNLSSEEQIYVRHYLGYADALIRSAEENASPNPKTVGAPESAQSTKEDLSQQSPAEQGRVRFVEEPSQTTVHAPARAA
jgi:hypothetical protein